MVIIRMNKYLFASVLMFGIFLSVSSGSYCAMTAGNLAISASMVGSGGITGTTDANSLFSVCGQPVSGGTSEAAGYSMNSGYTFTLTAVTVETTGAPTMEWVKINNMKFKVGDVLSPNSQVIVKLKDPQGVATIELYVDLSPTPILFNLNYGTTFEGQWTGNLSIPEKGIHSLLFFTQDSGGNGIYYVYSGKIVGGAVQVIGRTFNYPNPFSPMSGGSTTIQYILSTDAAITIIIYDITGHEVKRMKFSSGTAGGKGGTNQVNWNGISLGGEVVGNGMYLYKIISGDKVIGSEKLVIFDR